MQEIIGAALAAGATLIAAVLMYSSRINKLVDQLEQVKGMLDKESEKRFDEHGRLSGEHKELSGEHRELSGEHRELKDEIHRVIVYQESEKTARETAAKKLPEESGFIDMAKTVYKKNEQLQQEKEKLQQRNVKLSEKLKALQKENTRLKTQVMILQNDREDSMDINDMDLFNELDDELEL